MCLLLVFVPYSQTNMQTEAIMLDLIRLEVKINESRSRVHTLPWRELKISRRVMQAQIGDELISEVCNCSHRHPNLSRIWMRVKCQMLEKNAETNFPVCTFQPYFRPVKREKKKKPNKLTKLKPHTLICHQCSKKCFPKQNNNFILMFSFYYCFVANQQAITGPWVLWCNWQVYVPVMRQQILNKIREREKRTVHLCSGSVH